MNKEPKDRAPVEKPVRLDDEFDLESDDDIEGEWLRKWEDEESFVDIL